VLDSLADDRHARSAQQLAQFGEIVAVAQRADAEGALLGAAQLLNGEIARRCVASVAAAFHGFL
jgi:hypothetical protein